MKLILAILLLLFVFNMNAQTPCENNQAGIFECDNIDLLSQIPLSTMNNSVKANDIWGWTDPLDGKEYALVCLNEATAFVDVSDPINPIYLGLLPSESSQHTTWRDVKTYNDFAFIVSEDNGHGMQIFDLTKLRNVSNPPVTFSKDAYYDEFGSAHNIFINEDTGYAYVVGTTTFNGGPHFVNIQDPLNPLAAGGSSQSLYCHDAQVVLYQGPDPDHQGREILFGSNETELIIEDVTDKNNVVSLASVSYSNFNYTHQGWLTEDQQFFILGDELDEINSGISTRTIIFDVSDLDDPQFHFTYTGPTEATDHNGYVKDNFFYLANNAAGLRIIDINNIANGNMEEVAFFDSFPDNDQAGFNGSWSVYPYFASGNLVISDRAEGLLVVRPKEGVILSVPELDSVKAIVTPNPTSDIINVNANFQIKKITLVDITGKLIFSKEYDITQEVTLDLEFLESGMYMVNINENSTHKILKH